ncbi:phosphate/H+ symporter [Apodospora peruviana]|uniref:Phosphate/H+ symporter n=1 Tax=Apodospora peruviana TaxID=516989 RepID=A0AAE0I6I5_9PEZI|nr:phosphate/H+ symporter [Apodospora peruviana]
MDRLPEPMLPSNPHLLTHGGNKAFHNFANDYSHILDPNLRRRLALSDIDRVPFGLYHIRAVAVAGVGFFLDSYDIFSINLITTFLGIVFWQGSPDEAKNGFGGNYGVLPGPVNTALKASTSAGIVIGQVLFGWLADVFGRRRMYGIELGIIVLSTLNCALANPSPSVNSTGLLVFWRVMMGVGIGGDYPLSSVITSEFAPTRWRGAMMAAVFSMQGIGQLLCAIVALVVTAASKESFIIARGVGDCDYASGCQTAADRAWRIIVGFGALPALLALYYRITIPETPRYTFDVAQDVEKADADIKAYMNSQAEGDVDPVKRARGMLKTAGPALSIPAASWRDVYLYFKQRRNLKILLGTTLSWFFLDLAFYGLGLNNTIVLTAIGYSHGPTLYHALYNNAVGMIILACAGSLPGYWTAVLTIDTLGRKPLQIIGFVVLTLLFLILGFGAASLSETSLLVLYIVAQFFFNWGPNTTTFIVPGECFPTRYRSTGHGLSAAMGKVGAILAQVISIPLLSRCHSEGRECSHPWLDRLMQIFALFMLLGTFTSLLVPETKGMTLEELAGEAAMPGSYNTSGGGSLRGGTPANNNNNNAGGGERWYQSTSRWNPFLGGQPAGFFYHAHQSNTMSSNHRWPGHGGHRSPRVGIMTSPELAAQQQQQQQQAANRGSTATKLGKIIGLSKNKDMGSANGGRASRRNRGKKSDSSNNSSRLSGNTVEGGEDIDDDETPIALRSGMANMGVLPGWGAGWGRVDRGGGSSGAGRGSGGGPSIDSSGTGSAAGRASIKLHDVGSLLK